MIKIQNVEVVGWEAAIRGMRNPKNSWDRSDTDWYYVSDENKEDATNYIEQDSSEPHLYKLIGHNDLELMNNLAKGGPVHAKYRRMIVVYLDITAPLYWWKEFDTYKVGTVANSCSTMHKIGDKEFTLDDFSHEHLRLFRWTDENDNDHMYDTYNILSVTIINALNWARNRYLETKDDPREKVSDRPGAMNRYWWQMIQLLPDSYNQRRTIMLNYEVLAHMFRDREYHKQDEWYEFCKWIKTLPYSEIITGGLYHRRAKETDRKS